MEDEDSEAEEVVVATFFDAARDGNEEEVARLSSQCSRLVSWSGDRGTALHEATRQGHSGVITQLAKMKAPLCSVEPEHSLTALHIAAWRGDLPTCQLLASIEATGDERDSTPLSKAVVSASLNVVRFLLESGAQATMTCSVLPKMMVVTSDPCTRSKEVPIQTAEYLAIAFELLNAKADPNIARKLPAPLEAALGAESDQGDDEEEERVTARPGKGRIDRKEELEQNNRELMAKLEAKEERRAYRELLARGPACLRLVHYCAIHGLEAALCLLANHGGDVDVPDTDGSTPLHLAAQHGRKSLLRFLVEKGGCRVNVAGPQQATAIQIVATKGCHESLLALVQAKAKLNLPDLNGSTALSQAAAAGHETIVTALLECRASAAKQDNTGSSALHQACRQGHAGCVQQLLQYSAPAELCDSQMSTPLHQAVHSGNATVVALLLEHQAAVDPADHKGYTPLHHAALAGEIEMCRLLLQREASCCAVNERLQTPLHCAAHCGSASVASLILNHVDGPSALCVLDNAGTTPLELARERGEVELVELFNLRAIDIPTTVRTAVKLERTRSQEWETEALLLRRTRSRLENEVAALEERAYLAERAAEEALSQLQEERLKVKHERARADQAKKDMQQIKRGLEMGVAQMKSSMEREARESFDLLVSNGFLPPETQDTTHLSALSNQPDSSPRHVAVRSPGSPMAIVRGSAGIDPEEHRREINVWSRRMTETTATLEEKSLAVETLSVWLHQAQAEAKADKNVMKLAVAELKDLTPWANLLLKLDATIRSREVPRTASLKHPGKAGELLSPVARFVTKVKRGPPSVVEALLEELIGLLESEALVGLASTHPSWGSVHRRLELLRLMAQEDESCQRRLCNGGIVLNEVLRVCATGEISLANPGSTHHSLACLEVLCETTQLFAKRAALLASYPIAPARAVWRPLSERSPLPELRALSERALSLLIVADPRTLPLEIEEGMARILARIVGRQATELRELLEAHTRDTWAAMRQREADGFARSSRWCHWLITGTGGSGRRHFVKVLAELYALLGAIDTAYIFTANSQHVKEAASDTGIGSVGWDISTTDAGPRAETDQVWQGEVLGGERLPTVGQGGLLVEDWAKQAWGGSLCVEDLGNICEGSPEAALCGWDEEIADGLVTAIHSQTGTLTGPSEPPLLITGLPDDIPFYLEEVEGFAACFPHRVELLEPDSRDLAAIMEREILRYEHTLAPDERQRALGIAERGFDDKCTGAQRKFLGGHLSAALAHEAMQAMRARIPRREVGETKTLTADDVARALERIHFPPPPDAAFNPKEAKLTKKQIAAKAVEDAIRAERELSSPVAQLKRVDTSTDEGMKLYRELNRSASDFFA